MGTREGEWSSINLPRAIEQFDASYESAASGVYRTIESIRPNNRGAKEATRSFLPSFLLPPPVLAHRLSKITRRKPQGSLPNTAMHPRKLNAEEKKKEEEEEEGDDEKRSRRGDGGCKKEGRETARLDAICSRGGKSPPLPSDSSFARGYRIAERHYVYQSWKSNIENSKFPSPGQTAEMGTHKRGDDNDNGRPRHGIHS